MDIQIKPDAKSLQQKNHPTPIYLQPVVIREIEKKKKNGHLERATNIIENCFVRQGVISMKKDKKLKVAIDSRKFSEITVERRAQMPIMEELIPQISR